MSISEKRTQVYFPNELYRKIERKSRDESISVASIIREAVEMYLKEQDKVDWENDPLFKAVGIMDSRAGDLSVYHDKYLYGKGKKTKK